MKQLKDRFEVGELLGQGGQGKTYRGLDRLHQQPVAIKELSFDAAESWKAIELFEREAGALRQLDHQAIPSYVDAFHLEEEGTLRLFLVQEFVDGETMGCRIRRGDLLSTEEAIRYIEQILDVLDYLHSRHPPVIHRDIKPSNLIVRPDETLALVDFGAVQMVRSHTLTGSTIVGTSGYVAPEQLAGRTVPASDLYSLGATVVHLLTHIHPADLPMERMRLRFEKLIPEAPPGLLQFLRGVLEPLAEDRIHTIHEARSVLSGEGGNYLPAVVEAGPLPVLQRPVGSGIEIHEEGGELAVWIPASGIYRRIYWSSVLMVLATMAAVLPLVTSKALPILIGAFATFFLVGQIFVSPTRLVIGPDTFSLNRHTLNGRHRGWTENLTDIEIREAGTEKFLALLPMPAHLVLMEGVYPLHFGFGLTAVERRWVQGAVRRRLAA